ncbi:MAG: putative membrane protein [halophilic archaeon J07HX5]|nr:MAG: putative membrane protein [halophilic archaeon J07HX5]
MTTADEPPARLTRAAAVRASVIVYLKGLAMGAADAVPGISGGTIALITGIYGRLITAVTRLDPRVITSLGDVRTGTGRAALTAQLRHMDVPFLLTLGTGIATAVVIVARGVEAAFASAPGLAYAFFFGLIGASAVVLYEQRWLTRPRLVIASGGGFVVAFVVAGATTSGGPGHGLLVLFVAGAIAVAGMVLPGISGAFLLLLLGQYEYLAETLNTFVDGLTAGVIRKTAVDITAFVAGASIGLFTVAYVVRWALERSRAATLAFLLSLMLGALRLPVEEVDTAVRTWTPVTTGAVLGVAVLGASVGLLMNTATENGDE